MSTCAAAHLRIVTRCRELQSSGPDSANPPGFKFQMWAPAVGWVSDSEGQASSGLPAGGPAWPRRPVPVEVMEPWPLAAAAPHRDWPGDTESRASVAPPRRSSANLPL
jgi:hypothetical protein